MTDQISLLPMLDDADHPTWLLNGKPGMQNDCGVYTDNVYEFREGLIPHNYVCVKLCAEGDFILFEFSYSTKTYGYGNDRRRLQENGHRLYRQRTLAESSAICHEKDQGRMLSTFIALG